MRFFMSLVITLSILMTSGYPSFADYTAQTSAGEYFTKLFHKSEIISEQHVGEPSDYVWNETDTYTADYGVTLYKEADKDFTILNLADIHFSDYSYRVFNTVFDLGTIRNLVNDIQPDLIILSGDNVCDDSTYYSIRALTDLMESFQIPWAPIFGNHDDEGNCDLNYLCDVMMKGPHCLVQKGDSRMGAGNYVINIAEKTGSGDKVVETLVMMDSHHSAVNELQQQWYSWVAEGTKTVFGEDTEVTIFEHIPLTEYSTAYETYCTNGKDWADGCGGVGEKNESICCAASSNGFFDAIKASGNTKYVFCGHDHKNDFSVEYEGIRLTYMMKLGKNSGYQIGFDGGTVITVGSEGITTINHKVRSVLGFRDELIVNCK